MHTFRELILGAYLSSNNFKVRYGYNINNKTPDWCILNDKSKIKGIVELTNFHIDRFTEEEIKDRMNKEGISLVFGNKNRNNLERLYECIWSKIQIYQELVEKIKKPYVISIFGDFFATVKFKEVKSCLNDKGSGLFKLYPGLSGVLYFQEFSGCYHFEYANNLNAMRTIDISAGVSP